MQQFNLEFTSSESNNSSPKQCILIEHARITKNLQIFAGWYCIRFLKTTLIKMMLSQFSGSFWSERQANTIYNPSAREAGLEVHCNWDLGHRFNVGMGVTPSNHDIRLSLLSKWFWDRKLAALPSLQGAHSYHKCMSVGVLPSCKVSSDSKWLTLDLIQTFFGCDH